MRMVVRMSYRMRIGLCDNIIKYCCKKFKKSEHYSRLLALDLKDVDFSVDLSESKFKDTGIQSVSIKGVIENDNIEVTSMDIYTDVLLFMYFDNLKDDSIKFHVTSLTNMHKLLNDEFLMLGSNRVLFETQYDKEVYIESILDLNYELSFDIDMKFKHDLEKFYNSNIRFCGNLKCKITDGNGFKEIKDYVKFIRSLFLSNKLYNNKFKSIEIDISLMSSISMYSFFVSEQEKQELFLMLYKLCDKIYKYLVKNKSETSIIFSIYSIDLKDYDIDSLIKFISDLKNNANVKFVIKNGISIGLLEYLIWYKESMENKVSGLDKVKIIDI